MGVLVLYANGHRRLYSSDEEEVLAISGEAARDQGGGLGTIDPEDPSVHWWPSSLDFRTEARRHARRARGVGSFRRFLQAIRARRNLDTVLFFGHGGRDLLKFGDTVYIRTENIQGQSNDLSSHFGLNGRIILYACNAAYTPSFLSALANSLNVTVCGFRNGVRWNLLWDGEAPNRHIVYRGIHREDTDDISLPTNFTCSSPQPQPDESTSGDQHTLLLDRGVLRGKAIHIGSVRGGRRIPGPTNVA